MKMTAVLLAVSAAAGIALSVAEAPSAQEVIGRRDQPPAPHFFTIPLGIYGTVKAFPASPVTLSAPPKDRAERLREGTAAPSASVPGKVKAEKF